MDYGETGIFKKCIDIYIDELNWQAALEKGVIASLIILNLTPALADNTQPWHYLANN